VYIYIFIIRWCWVYSIFLNLIIKKKKYKINLEKINRKIRREMKDDCKEVNFH
jgi:hypothetical protein